MLVLCWCQNQWQKSPWITRPEKQNAGFLCVCLSVWICESYVVHHLNGTGLCYAPLTCIVHDRPAMCTMMHKGDSGSQGYECIKWLRQSSLNITIGYWHGPWQCYTELVFFRVQLWPIYFWGYLTAKCDILGRYHSVLLFIMTPYSCTFTPIIGIMFLSRVSYSPIVDFCLYTLHNTHQSWSCFAYAMGNGLIQTMKFN